jgi:transposase InsO family protein
MGCDADLGVAAADQGAALLGDEPVVNHKRVFRVYQEAGLAVKRRKRERLVRVGNPLEPATFTNEEWALDFVSDAIAAGRRIRLLNAADAYTRECLALEVDTSFASLRVTRVKAAPRWNSRNLLTTSPPGKHLRT